MKLTKKIIAMILCLCLALSASLALVACGDEDDGDTPPPPSGGCQHVGTLICEKCFELVYDIAELNFDLENPSIAIVLEDVSVTVSDDEYPEQSGTVTVDFAELAVSVDPISGAVSGFGAATMTMAGTHTGVENTFDVYGVIEDNKLYAKSTGNLPIPFQVVEQNGYYVLDIEKMAVSGNEEASTVMQVVLPAMMEWATENLVPVFEAIANDDLLGFIDAPAAKLINSFFKAENGKISLDLGVIKTWNEAAATKKVSELIDAILGEGVYGAVKSFLTGDTLYNLNVGQVIDYVQDDLGVDIVALFNSADAFVTDLMMTVNGGDGSADFGGALLPDRLSAGADAVAPGVLTSMLMQSTGMTISELLADDELRALSISDAIEGTGMSVVEVKSALSAVFTMLENTGVYELIFTYAMGMESFDPAMVASMVAQINSYIDMVSEMISLEITVADNVITKSDLGFDLVPIMGMIDPEAVADAGVRAEISVSSDANGITVDVDINVPDIAECDLACKVVYNYDKTVDQSKLADIKAVVEGIPASITEEIIKADAYSAWYGAAVDIDPVTGDAIAFYYDLEDVELGLRADGFVYVFNANDVAGIFVNDGCGDLLNLSYTVANVTVYDIWVDEVVVVDDVIDEETLIASAIEQMDEESIYERSDMIGFNFVYDPSNGDVHSTDTHSHDLALNSEDSFESPDCGGMCCTVVSCTECDYEVVQYYTRQHSFQTNITGNLNDGYILSNRCILNKGNALCGYTPADEIRSIDISGGDFTDLGASPIAINLGFTADTDCTLIFSMSADNALWMERIEIEFYDAEDNFVGNLLVYRNGTDYTKFLTAGEYKLQIYPQEIELNSVVFVDVVAE